jgi:hypothetical protein
MSGFSPSEIPILGDKSLTWFDPDWPWNLGRVASFLPCYSPVLSVRPDYSVMRELFDRPIIEIDFSKVSAVAMRTGCSGLLWEHCEPQQVLVKLENQWLVLIRHISEIEVQKFFCGKPDASNEIAWALRKELPYQTCVQLGAQGDRTERVIASTNYDGKCNLMVFNPRSEPYKKEWFSDFVRKMIADSKEFSVHCFKGDYAVRNAVDTLALWGFVQSKYWPTITHQFPELNELQDYLILLDYLYPNGSHPLHGKTSEVAKQSGGADNQADENGAIDAVARSMMWGGEQFNDIPARGIKVLDLLLKAYRDGNRVVTLDEIISLKVSVDGGMIGQVFKYKRGRHPVSKVIDDLGGGRYRLKHPRKDS